MTKAQLNESLEQALADVKMLRTCLEDVERERNKLLFDCNELKKKLASAESQSASGWSCANRQESVSMALREANDRLYKLLEIVLGKKA